MTEESLRFSVVVTTYNREALLERGLVKGKSGFLLKVLGGSELSKKLIVSAHAFSASAASAIQASGGEVKVL